MPLIPCALILLLRLLPQHHHRHRAPGSRTYSTASTMHAIIRFPPSPVQGCRDVAYIIDAKGFKLCRARLLFSFSTSSITCAVISNNLGCLRRSPLAISMYFAFSSIPIHLRISLVATSPVVPEPKNGSRTVPPSGQPARCRG